MNSKLFDKFFELGDLALQAGPEANNQTGAHEDLNPFCRPVTAIYGGFTRSYGRTCVNPDALG